MSEGMNLVGGIRELNQGTATAPEWGTPEVVANKRADRLAHELEQCKKELARKNKELAKFRELEEACGRILIGRSSNDEQVV